MLRSHILAAIATVGLFLTCACPFAAAQSNQEWIAYKQKCGIPANTAYNDWVAAGAKCNSTTSSTTAPTLTPQQQMGMAIGKVGADMLSQGIHNLFYGQPLDPATQQKALAAQQLNNSGVYLMGQHNFPGAINEFQKALALTPDDPLIKRNLHNAIETQKQSVVAGRTSAALGDLLNSTPAPPPNISNPVNLDPNVVDFRGIGKSSQPVADRSNLPADNANRLHAIITGSDSSVVDLSRSSQPDPSSLKTKIDALFGAPVPAPAPVQPQEIDQIFQQSDQNTNSPVDQSQNSIRSPAH